MKKPSKTALFAAAKTWNTMAIRELLAVAPGLIAAQDPRGRNALHLACSVKPGTPGTLEANGIATVKALLAAGSDPFDHVAVEGGAFRATPVWYAVAHGDNLPLVRMLLKRGANVDNCLFAATWNDNAPMLRELLKSATTIDAPQEGAPVLIAAIRWRKLAALQVLMNAGADVSCRDANGHDALFHARARKLPDAVIARLEALRPR